MFEKLKAFMSMSGCTDCKAGAKQNATTITRLRFGGFGAFLTGRQAGKQAGQVLVRSVMSTEPDCMVMDMSGVKMVDSTFFTASAGALLQSMRDCRLSARGCQPDLFAVGFENESIRSVVRQTQQRAFAERIVLGWPSIEEPFEVIETPQGVDNRSIGYRTTDHRA